MTKKFGSAHQQGIFSLSAKKSKPHAGDTAPAFERSKEAGHQQQQTFSGSKRFAKTSGQRRTMPK